MIIKIIGVIIIITLFASLIYVFIQHNKPVNTQPFVSVWEDKNKKGISYKHVTKDMIVNIIEITKEHNLEIIPFYGTLLGLVRHKGFIP